MRHVLLGMVLASAIASSALGGVDWVTVMPEEFQGAINNPLKGFRDYKAMGTGSCSANTSSGTTSNCADDTVERIIAHTTEITRISGKRFEELNVKLVPRVYLDWDGILGTPKPSSTGPLTCTPSTTTARHFRRGSRRSWRSSARPGTMTRASLPCRWA